MAGKGASPCLEVMLHDCTGITRIRPVVSGYTYLAVGKRHTDVLALWVQSHRRDQYVLSKQLYSMDMLYIWVRGSM